ncbi:hypothetical protein GIW81_00925 [Hyphomicrobium sp. xq]|uniref:5'-3' exonuclease domain-containing protein n=1 Tax=Hyphomicrobium album TaxID=2665159 RepID=A0A6I3KJF1_9HYPH|nr:hypothetical protein [Hyphomicrobium album]MTD92891.1 hypothetical protein [Hyphomicrobium album]
MTTLLIDGDILVYRWAYGAEKAIDWDDGIWTLHADANEACAMLDDNIAKLMKMLGAKNVVVALTGKRNFRKELWPGYKANRTKQRKPLCMPAVREHIAANYACLVCDGIEADDLLGIAGTKPGDRAERIIVTEDKDLLQIPGFHYRPSQPHGGVFAVTREEGEKLHLAQSIAGDPTDNYPGCPGYGIARARKMVEAAPKWETVRDAYLSAGLTERDALTQARLAKILTYDWFNHATRKPILWTPST